MKDLANTNLLPLLHNNIHGRFQHQSQFIHLLHQRHLLRRVSIEGLHGIGQVICCLSQFSLRTTADVGGRHVARLSSYRYSLAYSGVTVALIGLQGGLKRFPYQWEL